MTMNEFKPDNVLFDQSRFINQQCSTEHELIAFQQLQKNFSEQFSLFFPDNFAPKTIVVIPSLTLDQEVLAKVKGALHYEERMLCLLMLLRMPRTHVTFVSSMPIDPLIIDYYLHLLPGISGAHARERLTLLSAYDASSLSLTEKILKRGRLIQRIKKSIQPGHVAHLSFFNTTEHERKLAVKLGLPVYGCDPAIIQLGSKSGGRAAFLKAGIPMPAGAGNLHSYNEMVHAVSALKDMYPDLRKAVVKLNDGFSGDGNAIVRYPENLTEHQMHDWLHHNLRTALHPVASDLSVDMFIQKFSEMGGIVEAFIEGEVKTSPSVQCRINPLGDIDIISTHDQILGGDCGQVFIGAHFPANEQYRKEIAAMGRTIAMELKKEGVIGRFSIDFISVKEADHWKHYAIEINLRKGGTTHPYLMMQFLTDGHYNEDSGIFETASKQQRFYFASDNVCCEEYKGLSPQDLIEIVMFHGLHFNTATQKGVMFHMIGALSEFGKMGMVCIGESPHEAYSYYEKTLEVLNAECGVNCNE